MRAPRAGLVNGMDETGWRGGRAG